MKDSPTSANSPSAAPAAGSATDRSARLYQMLLDSIPSSVLLLDPQMHITSANINFLQKSRLRESEVIGQQLEAVFPPVIYLHMNLPQRVAAVFRGGEAIKGERMGYRAPGVPARTYYYSLIPFRWGNNIENVMLLMEDVTDMLRLSEEARQAERHLASVVESANDIVLSMDMNGRIQTWNTAAVRITEFDCADVLNHHLSNMCRPEQRPALAKLLARISYQGKTEPFELDLVRRDETSTPISWVFSARRDAERKVVGVVAVGRDLTETRKFEAQLQQSEKLAALGVMAGGIAHEIRNPLAVASSAAQLLLQKPLARDVQIECAAHIHRNVQRVADIIESLLRFARPSEKRAMVSLNLGRVIQEALALVANQARLGKIELKSCFPDRPVSIRGNASLLQQMVMNLVLNAINAMPKEGGEISAILEIQSNQAIIRVLDTGRGIGAGNLLKVFDPFFTTMPIGKGTGLGLSITYAIVEQHAGKIEIESEKGKGTTVTVVLPLETTGDVANDKRH